MADDIVYALRPNLLVGVLAVAGFAAGGAFVLPRDPVVGWAMLAISAARAFAVLFRTLLRQRLRITERSVLIESARTGEVSRRAAFATMSLDLSTLARSVSYLVIDDASGRISIASSWFPRRDQFDVACETIAARVRRARAGR